VIFFIFLACAMVGQVAHWISGAASRDILVSYFDYMRSHPYNTFSALVALNVAVVGMIAGGLVELTTQNAAMAIMAGYTCDSLFNRFPK